MAAADKVEVISTNERDFIVQCLKSNIRIDGRGPLDVRAVSIAFGQKSGTVEVAIGKTRVLCAVTSDIVPPFPDRPNEGFLNFNADFSPMASPLFRADRPSDKSVELARVVERGIKESRAIDTEALCILAGQKTDCANLATLCALLHFRRPDVTVIGDTVTVHSVADKQPVPLAMHHKPVCVSFAFYGDGDTFLVDPALKEELCADGELHLTLNAAKELCCMQQTGGCGVAPETLLKCAQIAALKAAGLIALVEAELKADAEKKPVRRVLNPFVVKPKSAAELEKTKGTGAALPAAGAAAASGAAAGAADAKAVGGKAAAAANLIRADDDDDDDDDADGDAKMASGSSAGAVAATAAAKPAAPAAPAVASGSTKAAAPAAAAAKPASAAPAAAATPAAAQPFGGGASAWGNGSDDDAEDGDAAAEKAARADEFDAFAKTLQSQAHAQAQATKLLHSTAAAKPATAAKPAAAAATVDSDGDVEIVDAPAPKSAGKPKAGGRKKL